MARQSSGAACATLTEYIAFIGMSRPSRTAGLPRFPRNDVSSTSRAVQISRDQFLPVDRLSNLRAASGQDQLQMFLTCSHIHARVQIRPPAPDLWNVRIHRPSNSSRRPFGARCVCAFAGFDRKGPVGEPRQKSRLARAKFFRAKILFKSLKCLSVALAFARVSQGVRKGLARGRSRGLQGGPQGAPGRASLLPANHRA